MNRRQFAQAWPLLQVTAAATLAWLVASRLHGQDDPFFAPMAAVIALRAPHGERGLQAVRLLAGVFLGVAIGEIIVAAMGAGYGRLAIASFVAMALATAIGGARVVVTQAATSAILTVIAAGGEAGVNRLLDVLIGGAVALVFSQVIFSPEPVALLRRAEAETLSGIARGLELIADAMKQGDEGLAEGALDELRALREPLSELSRLRVAGTRVARHSAVWRTQVGAIVREQEHADHLDLVASGSVMLARTALDATPVGRALLASRIHELSSVVAALAASPGDRATRQNAADAALETARPIDPGETPDSTVLIAFAMLRIVAKDVMVFAGLTVEQAESAMRTGETEDRVPLPPPTPRLPFGLDRRTRERRSSGDGPHRKLNVPDGHAT